MLRPRDESDLAELIGGRIRPLQVLGAGTKAAAGAPVDAEPLSVASLTGIVDYRPEELVLTARAATPLAEVQALLAGSAQRLAFEPGDLGALLGALPRAQTLGGVLGMNLSGSRRVTAGAARDHFLGFRAVNGRGEAFKAGGKVVKNVTGYDLPKLLAGSWGTLAVLTEVTLRAVPAAEYECTLSIALDEVGAAVRTMTAALGSSHEVTAAAFDAQQCRVLLRLEGFAPSVAARLQALQHLLHAALPGCESEVVVGAESVELWRVLGGAEGLADAAVLWRLSVPPSDAPRVVQALRPARYLLDWGGGLIWLAASSVAADSVRGALPTGGHATLLKAPLAERASVSVFQPQSAPLAALTLRVKHAFDPRGLLNPGRLG